MQFNDDKQALIAHLEKNGYIKHKQVKEAFLHIKREMFIRPSDIRFAYDDRPLSIGYNQTISAPHMVAIMVESLELKKGQHVLEIGSGLGYHAAIVSYLIGKTGRVDSIERIHQLAKNAQENLRKAKITNVFLHEGDGSLGLSAHAPYDRIYLTCAAPMISQPLLDQLADNGILLAPIGQVFCELTRITKKKDELLKEQLGGCAFVPLIGKHGF